MPSNAFRRDRGLLASGVAVSEVEPAIVFSGITKTFPSRDGSVRALRAVDEVDLTVRDHEFTVIVGPSGCGKSTLLNMCAGLMEADTGEIWCHGRMVSGVNSEVGYLTQDSDLLPWLTVADNVGLPLRIRGVGKKERLEKVRVALEQVGLAGFESHYPHELSGGMRKRVSIARTFIYQPRILLMDEPLGPLDAITRVILQELLLRIWEEKRSTVFFVTHDLTEALLLGDRVIVMSARPGRIKLDLTVPFDRPRDLNHLSSYPGFAEMYEQIWKILESEVRIGSEGHAE